MVSGLNHTVNPENVMLLYNDTVMQCLSKRQRALMLEWLEVPEGTHGIWPSIDHVPAPRLHNNLIELLEDKKFGFLTLEQRGFLEVLNLALENQDPPLYAQAVKRKVPLSSGLPSTFFLGTPQVLLDEEEFPGHTVPSNRKLVRNSGNENKPFSASWPPIQLEPKRLIDCLDDVSRFLAAEGEKNSQQDEICSKSQYMQGFRPVKKPLKRRVPIIHEVPVSNSFSELRVYQPPNQQDASYCTNKKQQRVSTQNADIEMPPTPYRLADALIDDHPTVPMGSRRLTQSQPEHSMFSQKHSQVWQSKHRSDSKKAKKAHDLWVGCQPDQDVLDNVIQYEQEYDRNLWQGAIPDRELLDIVTELETQNKPTFSHLDMSLAEFFFPKTQSTSSMHLTADSHTRYVLVPDSQQEAQFVSESPCIPEHLASQASSNDAQVGFQSGGHLVNSSSPTQDDADMAEEEDTTSDEIPRKRLCLLEGRPVLFHEGGFVVKLVESGLNGAARIYCIVPFGTVYNKEISFMQAATPAVLRTIRNDLEQHDAVKVQLTMAATFVKADDESKKCSTGFHAKTITVFQANRDLPERLDELFLQLANSIDDFQNRGSNWVLHQVDFMDVRIAAYLPIRGSSYIKLPKSLESKKACINVMNKQDNECFKWAVLSKLHPVKYNANRVSSYLSYKDELNFNGITFPIALDDIKQFETQNSHIGINVFGWKNGKPRRAPLYLTHNRQAISLVNLLLLKDGNKMHYCWIKRLSAFFSDGKNKTYFCQKCFLMFRNEKYLSKHECKCREGTIEQMPSENILKFKNYHRHWPAGCVIYADLEAIQPKVTGWDATQNSQQPHTVKQSLHEASGFCLITARRCCNSEVHFDQHEWYRGPNAVEKFLERALAIGMDHQRRIDNIKPPTLTPEQWKQHRNASVCYMCNRTFIGIKKHPMTKVLDHCHLCGNYRGAAHSSCNIQLRETRQVQVWFHNLRRYDGHFIFQQLGPIAIRQGLAIDCIPKGTYDYVTFSLKKKHNITRLSSKGSASVTWHLSFRDTFAFMPCGLATLVNNLKAAGKEKFSAMRQKYETDEKCNLMLRKGVMPYEFIDSWERFEEKQLPPREQWYNRLSLEGVSDEDYKHACDVWHRFQCNTFGDYHDLYMITDVLLLADVFENFRSSGRAAYNLDPAHYITLPSFSWDALLKNVEMNGTVLELLTDPDMYTFVEKGIRGGVSMVAHRYAAANNPMVPGYNEGEPHSWLMYLDANNLYGWAMSQHLPCNGFYWDDESESWSHERIIKLEDEGHKGYIFEVTLDVPDEVHNWHNMYPLAPESMLIAETDLSPYAHHLAAKLKLHIGSRKLVPHLRTKEHYVVHYRNLKFYLSHGLILKHVHRVLTFRQSEWMKPYIDFNTEKRKAAASTFEKDNFKLMNNACFGKSMEDVRKRRDIHFATTRKQFEKLVAKQNYLTFNIICEDLIIVELRKTKVVLNKPIYTGLSVLDLSKLLMYQFHYDVMIEQYGFDKLKLILTDTDSLLYQTETHDIYEDFAQPHMALHFDFSDYPKDHPLQSDVNKKALGKMKDELNGLPIQSVVALKPKMYSIAPIDGSEKKRAKGIKRAVVAKNVRHNDYLETLRGESVCFHEAHFLRPVKHDVFLMKENKRGLCCFDDKRFLLIDGIRSRPHGHFLNDLDLGCTLASVNGSDKLFSSEESSLSSQLHAAALNENSDSSQENSYNLPAITYSRQELTVSQQHRRAAIEALSVSQVLDFIFR